MKQPRAEPAPKRGERLKPPAPAAAPAERYDANIDHILRAAAEVFAQKGFGSATIRDIATRAQISFPRIYYYLRNKEELLYLILRRGGERLIERAQECLATTDNPEQRLRLFIRNHLEYQLDNLPAMKVLAREGDSLGAHHAAEIARIKRDYSQIARRLIENFSAARGKPLDREQVRILTSLLFGAMNWFYTWYEPARDAEQLGRIIEECFRMIAGAITTR